MEVFILKIEKQYFSNSNILLLPHILLKFSSNIFTN